MEQRHELQAVSDERRREGFDDLIPAWVFHGYVRVILDGLTAAIAMIDAYAGDHSLGK